MKKLISILLVFLTFTSYGQAEFEKIAITENVETAETSKIVSQQPGSGELNYINASALPVSAAVQDSLAKKLNISDLPANLTLYPTTTASDVSGYVVLVKDIHDPRYNTTAVDVSTPAITGTAQLISQRISDAGVLTGNPGVFNVTTYGNIRKLSGSGTAQFYFLVYHRDSAGTETLICTSSVSAEVINGTYAEFSASGIWDNGAFDSTDRIVIKTYANRIAGGSDPVYQLQFGGSEPVRTVLPVPFNVLYGKDLTVPVILSPDESLGKFKNGDTMEIKKEWDVADLAKYLGQKLIHAVFYLPTLSISGVPPVNSTTEVGTDISLTLTGNYTQNDGGSVNTWRIIKNGSNVSATNSFSETIELSTTPIVYSASADYNAGTGSKPNSLGDLEPNTIIAGTAVSSFIEYRGYRAVFYGDSSAKKTTSSEIRTLTKRLENSGNTFALNTGSTNTFYQVWLPTGKSIVSVIDLDALNANITTSYVSESLTVNDAGGNPITGTLYTYSADVPYSTNHRHQITTN